MNVTETFGVRVFLYFFALVAMPMTIAKLCLRVFLSVLCAKVYFGDFDWLWVVHW